MKSKIIKLGATFQKNGIKKGSRSASFYSFKKSI